MIDLTKMDVCDFCFDESQRCKRNPEDVNRHNWTFSMSHKTLRVCNEHMNELLECLKGLKDKGEV